MSKYIYGPHVQHCMFLSFTEGTECFLLLCFFLLILGFKNVFPSIYEVFDYINVRSTVAVRSQVAVLVLRGSVEVENRCPYQEAG